jgi:hypothetical protein
VLLWVVGVFGFAAQAQAQVMQRPAPSQNRGRAMPTMVADEPSHVSLGAELGPGGVLSAYNINVGPSALLFYGSLRASYDLNPTWAGSLVLRQWFLPANHATMLGVGLRWEPASYSFGHWFVDGAVGAVTTRYAWTFGYDIGGGFEWDLPDVPGFSLGPYVRYGSVVNPDDRSKADGRAWTAGASLSYHFGRAGTGTTRVRKTNSGTYHITIPDTDGDGVGDDQDQCRAVPQGKHADPFKVGCPEGDEDGDDIPDVDDACPATPPGDKPDPKRPGCPLVDSDGDGIADADDACPKKAGVSSPDRDKDGCPPGKRRTPTVEPEEEQGPPPESNPAPKATKKRKLK